MSSLRNREEEEHNLDFSFGYEDQAYMIPRGGKGSAQIDGETLILDILQQQFFRPPRKKRIIISSSQIANVVSDKKKLSLWIYPDDSHSTAPLHKFALKMRTVSDAERLKGALPNTVSPELQKTIDERNEFSSSLQRVTPRVFVTPAIVLMNVIVFLLMAVSGNNIMDPTIEGLLQWGGLFAPATLNGEWWRVISANYVHIGLIHIALNMWVFLDIGQLLERLLGHSVFLLVFIVSGITGSLASMHTNPEIVSAGASGAIFGLYGALFGYSLRQRDNLPGSIFKDLSKSSLSFVLYNVIIGFSVGFIDNAAHLGGLAGGFVLGLVASAPLDFDKRKAGQRIRLFGAIAASAIMIYGGWTTLQNPYGAYFSFTEHFASNEAEANAAYYEAFSQLERELISEEAFVAKIEEQSLAKWASVLEAAKTVELPENSIFADQLAFYKQIAALRTESLQKLTLGQRFGLDGLIQEYVELRDKADALIEEHQPQEK